MSPGKVYWSTIAGRPGQRSSYVTTSVHQPFTRKHFTIPQNFRLVQNKCVEFCISTNSRIWIKIKNDCICIKKAIKHCWKRRESCSPAFSIFTCFQQPFDSLTISQLTNFRLFQTERI